MGNSSESHSNGEPPHILRKRKAAAVEESPLRTCAALPTKLFRTRRLQPSTTLRLDLNRQQPSNSFEANSSPAIPPDLLLPPKSISYLSLLNEDDEDEDENDDEDDDDDDDDDDQFSLPLPRYVRERINRIDHIIKQQGKELTRILADQQKNIYKKIMGETEGKKLKDTKTELNKARLKIVELENVVKYLNGEIDKIRSNNKQLEEGLQEVRENRVPWATNNRNVNNAEASAYSTANQPAEVGESSEIPPKMPQCKACEKGLPTMILWPCHHLCLCKHCEIATHICPCCGTPKVSSTLVLFP